MKRPILLVAISLATSLTLAGCLGSEERIAAQNAQDDQKCQSYGARQGTDAYVNCRAQLDSARRTAEAIEDAAPPPSAFPAPAPATAAPPLRPMPIPCPPY